MEVWSQTVALRETVATTDEGEGGEGDEGVTWKDPRPSSNTSRSRLLTFSGEKAKTV